MQLQHKIGLGYFLSLAIIASMAAILVHERERIKEIEAESAEIRQVRHDINAALRFCSQFVLIDPKGNVSTVAAQDLTEAHLRRTYGVDVRLHEVDDQRFALVEGKAHHFQRRVENV